MLALAGALPVTKSASRNNVKKDKEAPERKCAVVMRLVMAVEKSSSPVANATQWL